jgi:hypothetical protein
MPKLMALVCLHPSHVVRRMLQANRTPIYKAELFFRCLDFRVQSGCATAADLDYLEARAPIVADEAKAEQVLATQASESVGVSSPMRSTSSAPAAAAAAAAAVAGGKKAPVPLSSTLSRMVQWLEQLRVANSDELKASMADADAASTL